MSYSYPLDSAPPLVERVDRVPDGTRSRRWVLRDDNQRHYHGVVRLAESPLYLELWWKADGRGREQHVGTYRLYLAALLENRCIRYENEGEPGDEVRLRFHRGDRSVVYIQTGDGAPALAIGTVDVAD